MANYRNAYKSDYLSSVDIEELIELKKSLIFTIREVKHEVGVSVAGKKGIYNIAYFVENIKPLVLNSGNCEIVRKFCKGGTDPSLWQKNILVELYVDNNVKMSGSITSGIRIKSQKPIINKIEVTDKNAIEILSKSTTLEELKNNWLSLSKEEKELQTVLAKKDELKTKLENDSKV